MQESSTSRGTLLRFLLPMPKNRALRAVREQLLKSLAIIISLLKPKNKALRANKRQLLGFYNNNVSSNKPIILSIALKYLYIILCARCI